LTYELGVTRVSLSFGASDMGKEEEVVVGVCVVTRKGEKADASASAVMRRRE
jgi:hypothetical protein